jgi:hypothetical protein
VTASKELFHRYKLWHPYHHARSPFDFAPERGSYGGNLDYNEISIWR